MAQDKQFNTVKHVNFRTYVFGRNISKEQTAQNQTSSINSAISMPLANGANYVPLSTWIRGHSRIVEEDLKVSDWRGGSRVLGRNHL